jgi:hypothetical protein
MDFVAEFAPDARSQWEELDFLIQELVRDKVEELLHNPPAVTETYPDIAHEGEDGWHYVFLSVNIDHAGGRMTIAGVNHFIRRKPP